MRWGWSFVTLVAMQAAMAQVGDDATRYISDETAVTLRADKGMTGEVVALIKSGTRVELVEHDEPSGYSRVRVGPRREGWVLTRYLSDQPAARERLAVAESELAEARSRLRQLQFDHQRLRQQATERLAVADKAAAQTERQAGADGGAGGGSRPAPTEQDAPTINAPVGARYGMSEMLTGAGLFVAGLLVGLILPLLPRATRRRRWTPEL